MNFRSGPGTSHAVITKLPKGTPLTARGPVEGTWWKVTTKGRTGWIHVSYLHAAPKSGYTTTSRLNLRTGASKSGRIIKTLPKGVAVKHTGAAHGNWWKVTSQGKTGWVSISHIRRGTPKKPTQPDCRKAKCIALTFDDGPGAHTNRLLNILSDEKVPATFFLVGNKVDARSSVVKKMARAGHEVASHTWSHPSLPGLSNVAIKRQVRLTDAAIKRATGEVPSLLRPPYGARNPRVDKAVGKPLILWDVDTRDWEHKNPKKTISISLRDTRRGSIILMHDVHSTTVDAVPQLIKRLRSRGYTFVTVTTLLSQTKLTPGSLHYRAK